jgi:hypothetical protein
MCRYFNGKRTWVALSACTVLAGLLTACAASSSSIAPVVTRSAAIRSTGGPGWHTTAIPSPPGSADLSFTELACPNLTGCVADGSYGLTSGRRPVMVRLRMPADAATTFVNGLACPSAGYCVAVGSYHTSAGTPYGFTATGSDGRWARARPLTPPGGSRGIADIFGVTCTGPGACVAVGDAISGTGRRLPAVVTESGGTWGRAAFLSPPRNFARGRLADSELSSVACSSAGSCLAVGTYAVRSGLLAWPMAAVESGGRWQRALQIPLPADASQNKGTGGGGLLAASCAPGGPCLAVGGYVPAAKAPNHGLAVTEDHGRLGRTSEMPGQFLGVACNARFCVVSPHNGPALAYSGGHWRRMAPIQPPASMAGRHGFSLGRENVACFAGGQCVSVGTFTDNQGRGSFLVSTRH